MATATLDPLNQTNLLQAQAAAPVATAQTAQTAQTAAPGLIGTAANPASTVAIDPAKQTVQGQMAGIIADNSPLMQTAKTNAAQDSNSRGLLNSTMGVQAGQQAVINTAMPIAQQDSNTYNNTAQFNAGQLNDIAKTNQNVSTQVNLANTQATNNQAQFNAQQTNNVSLANADTQKALVMQNYDAALKTSLANADAATKVELQNLDGTLKTNLANIQANYQGLMQTSSSATSLFNGFMSQATGILTDPNMDAASKQNSINNLIGSLQSGLTAVGSLQGVDFGTLLHF